MSKSIEATPGKAPFPVTDYLRHSSEPEDLFEQCGDATSLPCRIPVNVGIFFGGANNCFGSRKTS